MDLERERESSPSTKTTFSHLHLHLERALEIFTERKRAWRLEIDKLGILISILFTERELEACRRLFYLYYFYLISIFIYDFSKFDFLVFLCLIFWVCMIFSRLCSSVFLMKMMLDLNSCVFYF